MVYLSDAERKALLDLGTAPKKISVMDREPQRPQLSKARLTNL